MRKRMAGQPCRRAAGFVTYETSLTLHFQRRRRSTSITPSLRTRTAILSSTSAMANVMHVGDVPAFVAISQHRGSPTEAR